MIAFGIALAALIVARRGKRSLEERLARTLAETSARVEEKIRESEQEKAQLAAMLSALAESVVAIDHQWRILFLNSAAGKLFQVNPPGVKGRRFLEVLRSSPLNDVLNQVLRERRPATQEITILSPEEHILVVHAVSVSYGEEKTGVLAALQDVTEVRRLERVRQEFVANVSHELQTPLTSILGFTETLLDGAIDDPAHNREFLETIQDHANRLKRLIADILDLSAMEAKQAEFHWETVSVAEVVSRLMKGLAPMAQAKKVTMTNNLPGDLPKVRADREKLAQILMNLIDNAVKFNKSGGRVEISAQAKNDQVTVFIKDTGSGIPEADLPRIFERFYRVDKARSREMGGTGLGLAIVKHLVEAHQGTIGVESRFGAGSTFKVTLPTASHRRSHAV